MRLSRGTIILIVAMVVVIVAALLINNNPASAPAAPTPTATIVTGGPLFETLDANQEAINRLQVRDNLTGESIAYVKTENGLWVIEGSNASIDQQPITDTVLNLAALDANDTFESDDPAAFGLAEPGYSVFISTSDGDEVYVMQVGGKTFNNARYYVTTASARTVDLPETSPMTEATAEADATAEATAEPVILVGTLTISTIPQRIVGTDILQLFTPALLPEVTPELTPEAEATALPELISTPGATEATPEVTDEATPEVTAEATEGA